MESADAILSCVDHRPWPLPEGRWVMRQSWYDFMLMHWRVPAQVIRPLVPEPLELDLWEGEAFVGVVPFRMEHVRPPFLGDLPWVSSFLELNVRTYVKHGGKRGVYFLSLECDQPAAVEVARLWFGLPYMHARMTHVQDGNVVRYRSERTDRRGQPAVYVGSHRTDGAVLDVVPGTLEHFLIERYALFTVDGRGVWRGDVHHRPWPVRRASLEIEDQTLLAALGIELDDRRTPDCALWTPGVDTLVWNPVKSEAVG